MAELSRRIVSRLRRYIGNRRKHKRADVKLAFTLTLSDPHASSNGSRRIPTITGHTLDISETGVALIVPAIRIGEHYLTGSDKLLLLKLELPDGPMEMAVTPVRYEDQSSGGYLIGARIKTIDDTDRSSFESFLNGLLN
jgi:c-di-GMP-binding flagellar brake protein YcgR